jgi:hypothetical protein
MEKAALMLLLEELGVKTWCDVFGSG